MLSPLNTLTPIHTNGHDRLNRHSFPLENTIKNRHSFEGVESYGRINNGTLTMTTAISLISTDA
jgi:hypothetical protein